MISNDGGFAQELDPDYVHKEHKSSGLCPICGEHILIMGMTKDGRLIGSCGDAFTQERWEEDD